MSIFNITAFLVSVGWFGMYFALVQFLRGTWDYGLLEAALLVTPIPFGAGVLGILGGRVADRIGYRSMLIAGAVAFAVGSLWMMVAIEPEPNVVAWMIGIVPIAIGTGLVFPSFQGGAVIDTPPDQYAVAVGVNQTVQRIGSALGGAVAIALHRVGRHGGCVRPGLRRDVDLGARVHPRRAGAPAVARRGSARRFTPRRRRPRSRGSRTRTACR